MCEVASESESLEVEVNDSTFETAESHDIAPSLTDLLNELQSIVPPLWPLQDYVAVNPFFGLAHKSFLDTRQLYCSTRDCDLLMPRSYFHSLLKSGQVSPDDIEEAFQQCQQEYPDQFAPLTPLEVRNWVDNDRSEVETERKVLTVAENLDGQQGSTWSSHIINDISRYVSAHYDEGQAIWPSPWKSGPLYQAWCNVAKTSRRMEQLGISDFRSFMSQLPESASQAIEQMLHKLAIPRTSWRSFLLCEMFSVSGWASYIRYRGWKPGAPVEPNEDLIGLLAIRLAYDAALARSSEAGWPAGWWAAGVDWSDDDALEVLSPPTEVLARYCLQVASEIGYRRNLCDAISAKAPTQSTAVRRDLQMVFCIDVRSEVFRRNLESVDHGVETFGFAGFFGMSIEYVPLGASSGVAQCPVLLNPAFQIHETIQGADDEGCKHAVNQRQTLRSGRKLWKSFQNSAASCFSFVESIGLGYFARLITDSMRVTRTVSKSEFDGVPQKNHKHLGPDQSDVGHQNLSLDQKLSLTENMLRNLGLTQSFARIVAICGHECDVVNNPYKAGLDCGACGGHSGEPNARFAAGLLNNPQVRQGLAGRGILIPEDTWFIAAVHNTTTDQITFFDTDTLPAESSADFQRVQNWTLKASGLCRAERAARLGSDSDADVLRRSRDWAEVRPEWGLAGNAAFIVAPRLRTAGLNLSGRTFMHSYDYRNDLELKVLELIMTAPMVVTSWINLQYYASAVDNRAFGSGNKLIHNVVGQLGVFEGNGGDLKTGLPWQSVHDGQRFQHEPLRLLVMIESPRASVGKIVERHSHVRDLVTNGWLSLTVLDGSDFYRWTSAGTWEELTSRGPAPHGFD